MIKREDILLTLGVFPYSGESYTKQEVERHALEAQRKLWQVIKGHSKISITRRRGRWVEIKEEDFEAIGKVLK